MRRRDFLKLGGISLLAGAAALLGAKQPAEAAPAEHWTRVHWVRTLANLNVRVGPSTAYRRLGLIWAGHVVRVLAVSANWRWWCIRWGRRTAWISADPYLTRPLHHWDGE